MDVKVNWQGQRLSFIGTADSGFSVPLSADNDGFRPLELMLTSLAGCTAMDVISIMMKKRQDVTDFEVRVHGDRADTHPRVFTRAIIEYLVTGYQVDEIALQRSIELSAAAYCPAQAMLNKVMPIELKYQVFEDLGNGQRSLVKSGICSV